MTRARADWASEGQHGVTDDQSPQDVHGGLIGGILIGGRPSWRHHCVTCGGSSGKYTCSVCCEPPDVAVDEKFP